MGNEGDNINGAAAAASANGDNNNSSGGGGNNNGKNNVGSGKPKNTRPNKNKFTGETEAMNGYVFQTIAES